MGLDNSSLALKNQKNHLLLYEGKTVPRKTFTFWLSNVVLTLVHNALLLHFLPNDMGKLIFYTLMHYNFGLGLNNNL
jgi:hypothetical protein